MLAGRLRDHRMSHYEVLQAGPEDHSAVLDFVAEHFVPHEPLNCSMNLLSPGYRIPFFDRWLESYLRQEDTVTMVGRHVETGEMLGVCVVEVERSSFKSYSPSPTDTGPSYSVCPEKLRKVFAFLDWLKLDLDIGKECEVKEWGDVILITCRSDLRTPGLGTELARRAVQAVRDRGVKVSGGEGGSLAL